MISQKFVSRHLLRRSALSDLLLPLSLLYGFVQAQRRKSLPQKAWRPPCKVISVGNLASGGGGKTPFTIWLAGLLNDAGIPTGISHRGYKGAWENTPSLVSDRKSLLADVSQAGDEAHLIAASLPGIPVVAGKRRVAAISVLLGWFPDTEIVVMDDALQHLGVARDLDIVCFSAETGIGNGRVLPAGYLREPLSSMDPSQISVVISRNASSDPSAIYGCLARRGLPVFACEYQVGAYVDAMGNAYEPESLRGKRLYLVSGIAHPESFAQTVKETGLYFVGHKVFPDHYAFDRESEIKALEDLCLGERIDHLVCTQKDLGKLARHQGLGPKLLAPRIRLACSEQDKLMALVKSRLGLS